MKCQACGSALHIEEEKCPHCGKENPYYKKHRQEMHAYRQEFSEVKQDVYKKTGMFTGLTVKISIIAVLIAAQLMMLFTHENTWRISREWKTKKAEQRLEEHGEALERLEKERNYLEFIVYYEENNLNYVEALKEYKVVSRICSEYRYLYKQLLSFLREEEYISKQQRVEYICESLETIYESMEQNEYSDAGCYGEAHREMMEAMKADISVLLVAYANIDKEEAEKFDTLSGGNKRIALERGLLTDEE